MTKQYVYVLWFNIWFLLRHRLHMTLHEPRWTRRLREWAISMREVNY